MSNLKILVLIIFIFALLILAGCGGGGGGTGAIDEGETGEGTELGELLLGAWECNDWYPDMGTFEPWEVTRYGNGTWVVKFIHIDSACIYYGTWYLDGTLLYEEATHVDDPRNEGCLIAKDISTEDLNSWIFYDDCYDFNSKITGGFISCCSK